MSINKDVMHVKNLVALAQADGVIDDEEKDLLYELANEIGIESGDLDLWISNAKNIKLELPDDHKEAENHLINMIMMANADGHFTQTEYELCSMIADKLPYSGLEQALVKRMNISYLKNMIALASADGHIDESEMKILQESSIKAGLSKVEFQHLIDTVDEYKYFIPESYEDRETQLIQMLTVAFADGEFSKDEYDLCKMVAEKLDFTEEELKLIIKLSFKGEIQF